MYLSIFQYGIWTICPICPFMGHIVLRDGFSWAHLDAHRFLLWELNKVFARLVGGSYGSSKSFYLIVCFFEGLCLNLQDCEQPFVCDSYRATHRFVLNVPNVQCSCLEC